MKAYKLDVGVNFPRTWVDVGITFVRVTQDSPAFVHAFVDLGLEFLSP